MKIRVDVSVLFRKPLLTLDILSAQFFSASAAAGFHKVAEEEENRFLPRYPVSLSARI